MRRPRLVLPETPRCQGTFPDGSRCNNRPRFDGLCSIHKADREITMPRQRPVVPETPRCSGTFADGTVGSVGTRHT